MEKNKNLGSLQKMWETIGYSDEKIRILSESMVKEEQAAAPTKDRDYYFKIIEKLNAKIKTIQDAIDSLEYKYTKAWNIIEEIGGGYSSKTSFEDREEIIDHPDLLDDSDPRVKEAYDFLDYYSDKSRELEAQKRPYEDKRAEAWKAYRKLLRSDFDVGDWRNY